MVESNGGGLTTGQRLERIERDVRDIKEYLEGRIAEHRRKNEQTVEKLGDAILTKVHALEPRIEALEIAQAADKAVERYKRWIFGGVVFLIANVVLNVIAVLQT